MCAVRTASALAGILLVGAACVVGQDGQSEQSRALAKRAAAADAYRKLRDVVYALPLNDRTRVADFVAESDAIRDGVDELFHAVRFGEPAYAPDGVCTLPADVSVADVLKALRAAHVRLYKGGEIRSEDLDAIAAALRSDFIGVNGTGSARADLPPGLPAAVVDRLGPAPSTGPSPPRAWVGVRPEARLLALRAATADAQRRLAERIGGLRLTPRTVVRDFVLERELLNTELSARLIAADPKQEYLHDDALLVEVSLALPIEQAVACARDLHARHYRGDEIESADIERLVRSVVQSELQATGLGAPPTVYIRRSGGPSAAAVPDWTTTTIEAVGEAADPDVRTPQGKLRASRAAELDARRMLAEQIAGLKVDEERCVRDVAGSYGAALRIDALAAEAIVSSTRFTGDKAIVTVSAPGMRIWSVVSDLRSGGAARR